MRKLKSFFFVFVVCTVFQASADNIDYKFTLTTSATTSFQFIISAAGTFNVNCGDNGTLSGTGVSGTNTINRSSNISETLYTCTYSSSIPHTIQFGGTANGYSTNYNTPAIRFNVSNLWSGNSAKTDANAAKVIYISGSLGEIFGTVASPTIGQSQPRFVRTFFYAINLTGAIPENLFNGVYGQPTTRMFRGLFESCGSLTGSIPSNLFSGLSGSPTEALFDCTFGACSSLTGTIPENLFSGISGEMQGTPFFGTFYGTTNLSGYVPGYLFKDITGSASQLQKIFMNSGLDTNCPEGTTPYTTGYESAFDGKAVCLPLNSTKIPSKAESANCVYDTLGTYENSSELEPEWKPNTVNITWYSGDIEYTTSTCLYDGTITLPQIPPEKQGYTFNGWQVKHN